MPKSFLIKKILGLDEDQSVPSANVEDGCDELSLDDPADNAKRTISSLPHSSNRHGQSLLHFPEYMNQSLALHSYLIAQKQYYSNLSRSLNTSICYCKDCLNYFKPTGLDQSFTTIYHNPFYLNQRDSIANTTNCKGYFPVSPRKRTHSSDAPVPSVANVSPKIKIRVLQEESIAAKSPPAIVPEIKVEIKDPSQKKNEDVKDNKRDVDPEIDTAYGSEESLDSFTNASVQSESSRIRRDSEQLSEYEVDCDGKCNEQDGKTKEFSCANCPMTFARSSDLQRHSLIHSKEKPYVCYICDRGFTWFGNFQKHVLSHNDDYKIYHPLLFMKNTAEEELIIREGANFKCKLCQKQFTRMSGLRTHVRMHTGQRPFKCNTCSFAFTTSRALKMHMRIHTGERPYKCDECPKAFTRRDELQAHIYMHKGEKPFKCDQCSSAFIRYGHLQRHLLTHSADKPYKCKWCTKSFTQYRNLQTHTYKHTGERPFKCNFCGKGFTQYGTLQAHERTHTGKKPFQCKDCDKAFITSSHLRWHMKRHHNDDKEAVEHDDPKEE